MALVVQKYGGSSVADDEKIRNVARRVAASAPGRELVVVVSAMGKTTDHLVGLAHQVSPAPDPREMDMLLATGEQVTIALLAMASLGAKVLQSRSVEFAKKYGVTVHVRSTFKPDPGTLVTKEEQGMEEVVVTGVTHDRSQAKISILRVPDRPGIAAQVFGAIATKNVVVDMIVQNISRDGYTDMSFTLPRGDHRRAVTALEEVARSIGALGVVHDERVAKVSIVGVGMRSHGGVASKMFATLSKEGINIQMISTSEMAISCVIEDKYAELAVRALHDAFEVGKGANR